MEISQQPLRTYKATVESVFAVLESFYMLHFRYSALKTTFGEEK